MSQSYQEFLATKGRKAVDVGFEWAGNNPKLFDWQNDVVRWALRKGRAAVFSNCGTGKTSILLQWSNEVNKHTGKPILILTPLAVAQQTKREGEKFGIRVNVCRTQADVVNGINVVNYEMADHFEDGDFWGGVVLDESSAIKHKDSKTRNQLQEKFKATKFKLCCTATPSPNDYMELGTHAEYLGVMKQTEMLAMFFVHDGGETQKWRLKGHAEKKFFEWVSSWAACFRDPKDIGYSGDGYWLPELHVHDIVVKSDSTELANGQFMMFAPTGKTLLERRSARRNSLEQRVAEAAKIANATDEQVLVWCDLNSESKALTKAINGAVEVEGCMSLEDKEAGVVGFLNGTHRVLVSKPSIAGYGINAQNCHIEIFVGLSDCYDDETEILTHNGWKHFGNLTMEDEIATVNPESLCMEYQKPERIIYEPYSGEMIHFKSKNSFDLMVTPNHKLFTRRPAERYPTSDGSYKLEYAGDLADNYKRMFRRMLAVPKGFGGEDCESVSIPVPEEMRINSRSKVVKNIAIVDYLKLIGWYVSEGYCRPLDSQEAGRIVISQTDKHPEHREEIITLLTRIGLHVNGKTKDITGYSFNLAKHLVDTYGAGSHNVHIPQWVKDMPKERLVILRDTMLKGDGCHSHGRTASYRTASKQLAEDFYELCIKTGVAPSIRKVRTRHDGKTYESYSVQLQWSSGVEPYISREPETVQYSGMIGCVTVPNHVVIVRRNGRTVVSGNSFENMYQAIRRCWRFGQTQDVEVFIITSDAEGAVKTNIERKQAEAERMTDELVVFTRDHLRSDLRRTKRDVTEYKPKERMEIPAWLTA